MYIKLSDVDYEKAISKGLESLSKPHAIGVTYDETKNLLNIEFNTKAIVSFNPKNVEILKDLSDKELSNATVTPSGDGLIFGNGSNSFAVSLPGLLSMLLL